jgi:hypothetical protein
VADDGDVWAENLIAEGVVVVIVRVDDVLDGLAAVMPGSTIITSASFTITTELLPIVTEPVAVE